LAREAGREQATEEQAVGLRPKNATSAPLVLNASSPRRHRPIGDHLREGDVLVVSKLDRLARSIAHLCDVVKWIEKKKTS
jgi:Resolvase, N terminal domain